MNEKKETQSIRIPATTAFWHKASYDRFIQEQLPQLLAERLPLAGYRVNIANVYTCQVIVTLMVGAQEVEVTCDALPYPDDEGIFVINGNKRVVVPSIAHSALDAAEVKCVGDMLIAWVNDRLGAAPTDLPWDAALLRAWLPLDRWLNEFMTTHPFAQHLDDTNWLARQTHLRRLFILNPTALTHVSQFGRVCPLEIPEGPNMGRIFSLAVGAAIVDGKIVINDPRPESSIGLTASMIPGLAHDDPNRLLMGANMLRQWLPYGEPEPALVQTGNEPAAADFWCGRNLLTAFIPWSGDTFEDGIVLSESGARHLSNLVHGEMPAPHPDWTIRDAYHAVEPGDKLSNRHGSKGVVSRILPDAQMPRLADGTPVELIFSGSKLPGRMNVGQLWEAVLGRLARAEGTPVITPPFTILHASELGQRLAAAGLPADGQERLIDGSNGETLLLPSTVGWVYWGRTAHLAREKLTVGIDDHAALQQQTEAEFQILHNLAAYATIQEQFNRSANEAQAPASPQLAGLTQRLAAASLALHLTDEQLHFAFAEPTENRLQLAHPVPHPWLHDQVLSAVGKFTPAWHDDEVPAVLAAYQALEEVNTKLQRLLSRGAPAPLTTQVRRQLEETVGTYCAALLKPADVRFASRVRFSGRAVLAPGPELSIDQVGLPEAMAWAFFGPGIERELGAAAVAARTATAAQRLDDLMAQSWVLLHHIPSVAPTNFLALRPLRIPERALRLPLPLCRLFDVDFDGDQAAVYLPLTAAGQREAGGRLSVVGHLRRDPALLAQLIPTLESMWGLAWLSLSQTGQQEIATLLGQPLALTTPYLTRPALYQSVTNQMTTHGIPAALATLEQLWQRGNAVARMSGLSLSPQAGATWTATPMADSKEPAQWQLAHDQALEQLLATTDYTQDFGPCVLAVKSGANPESHLRALAYVLGVPRLVNDVAGQPVQIQSGFCGGLTPAEFFHLIPGARAGMRRLADQWEQALRFAPSAGDMKSFHVLARARRAEHPGIVFARAAAIGEVDPLVDEESRLFVGLPLERGG
jgi:hypothetical protein